MEQILEAHRALALPTGPTCFLIAGFTKRAESPYDPFGAGHSSTSISAALGMAVGRDVKGRKNNVVAVSGRWRPSVPGCRTGRLGLGLFFLPMVPTKILCLQLLPPIHIMWNTFKG